MSGFLIFTHLIAATIWTGGHLFLSLSLLPEVLRTGNVEKLLQFERKYEKVGMPALLWQVISGFFLAYTYNSEVASWFSPQAPAFKYILSKWILLFLTVLFAVSANFFVIPKLQKHGKKYLRLMAVHILFVTLFSVLFLWVGISFRLQLY